MSLWLDVEGEGSQSTDSVKETIDADIKIKLSSKLQVS